MPYRDPDRRTAYQREYQRLRRAGDCQTPSQTLVPLRFGLKTAHDLLALLAAGVTVPGHRGPWRGLEDVEHATLEYVDWFNHRRLHGELGLVLPAEFEADYHEAPPAHWRVPNSQGTPGSLPNTQDVGECAGRA